MTCHESNEGGSSSLSYSWIIAVGLCIAASAISNLGLNIQKYALNHRGIVSPRRFYTLWLSGFAGLVLGAIADFTALGFGAQSIIAPLGSLTLVCNVVFARMIQHENVDQSTLTWTLVIIAGSAVSVGFASHKNCLFSVDELFGFYRTSDFAIYFSVVAVTVTCMLMAIRWVERQQKLYGSNSREYLRHERFHRFSYASIAGIAGAQSILFAKTCVELLADTIAGRANMFSYPPSYAVLLAMATTVALQVYWLNCGLARWDALYNVPIFQSFWIVGSVVSGGVVYREFEEFNVLQALMFPVGVLLTIAGVYFLSQRESAVAERRRTESMQDVEAAMLMAADGMVTLVDACEPALPCKPSAGSVHAGRGQQGTRGGWKQLAEAEDGEEAAEEERAEAAQRAGAAGPGRAASRLSHPARSRPPAASTDIAQGWQGDAAMSRARSFSDVVRQTELVPSQTNRATTEALRLTAQGGPVPASPRVDDSLRSPLLRLPTAPVLPTHRISNAAAYEVTFGHGPLGLSLRAVRVRLSVTRHGRSHSRSTILWAVDGFPFVDGVQGPASLTGRVRVGDLLVGINGETLLSPWMSHRDAIKRLNLARRPLALRFRSVHDADGRATPVRDARSDTSVTDISVATAPLADAEAAALSGSAASDAHAVHAAHPRDIVLELEGEEDRRAEEYIARSHHALAGVSMSAMLIPFHSPNVVHAARFGRVEEESASHPFAQAVGALPWAFLDPMLDRVTEDLGLQGAAAGGHTVDVVPEAQQAAPAAADEPRARRRLGSLPFFGSPSAPAQEPRGAGPAAAQAVRPHASSEHRPLRPADSSNTYDSL